MKFKYHILGLTLTSLTLTACVDESFVEKEEPVWQQGDVPYYITLKLKPSSDTFTRAEEDNKIDNFQPGLHAIEHAISPDAYNFAIFFDEHDDYISCADLYSVNEIAAWEDGNTTTNVPSSESTYKCRFYGFAHSQPAKVLVVVNAPKKIYDQVTDFPGWNLEEVMKNQVWNEPGILNFDNNGDLINDNAGKVHISDPRNNLGFYTEGSGASKVMYFTMTNSTYLTKNNDGSFKINCAQEFPEGSITTDPSEIKNLTPVTIYLERMVSKFNLTPAFDVKKYIPTSAQALDVCRYIDGELTYSSYNWGIQLLAWGLNGLETSNYIFKNIPYQGEELTSSLRNLYNSGWNSAYNHRCFWSEDPHYYKDPTGKYEYPWQFDDARDQYDSRHQEYYGNFHSYDDTSNNFALAYYPFQWFCSYGDGSDSFMDKDGNIVSEYNYEGNTLTFYTPENTFVPGLTVDLSRGSRAYELAGTHVILCARLLLPNGEGTEYQAFDGNLYRNRVGVSYVDELSMFEDFLNAVNYKLNSQQYLYYKFYEWNRNLKAESKANYRGQTIRARSEGDYALYCYFPSNPGSTISELAKKAFNNNVDLSKGFIIELTPDLLESLYNDSNHYQLYKDADAINADGKVIPWILYRTNPESSFTPLRLMILEKKPDDASSQEFITQYNFDKSNGSSTEFIRGNPDEEPLKTYLAGNLGSMVGLSSWGTRVKYDNFTVTGPQGEIFKDDFSGNLANWTNRGSDITNTPKGSWIIDNGELLQNNEGTEGEIFTVTPSSLPRTYTIDVDAKRLSGREGFVIVINYTDKENYCWWNVGGWGNSRHELELVKGGNKTIYDAKNGSVTTGTNYHAKIKVNGSNIKCYLNGKLIHDVSLPMGREIQYELWDTGNEQTIEYNGDDNDVQSIFFETWGVADCFKKGLMYYAVPIYAQDKNGRPAVDYEAELESNANNDFKNDDRLKYYYGVVRNNWYKFNVHSIKDIGIPVSDPTKPIVPNYHLKLDQNKVEMEILQWHMEDQTVTIPF